MQVNDDTPASWRVTKAVVGRDADTGGAVPVVVGLVETAAGGVQVALQVGDDRRVILALQDANQLALNLNETTAERLRVTGERLGDGEP